MTLRADESDMYGLTIVDSGTVRNLAHEVGYGGALRVHPDTAALLYESLTPFGPAQQKAVADLGVQIEEDPRIPGGVVVLRPAA